MFRLFLLLILLNSVSSFATSYKVKLVANLKHKDTTQSTKKEAVVELGKKWTIPIDNENDLKIEMMITKPQKNDPKIKYPELSLLFNGKIYKKEAGKLILISSPKIIALINQEAILTIENDDESTIKIAMTASE